MRGAGRSRQPRGIALAGTVEADDQKGFLLRAHGLDDGGNVAGGQFGLGRKACCGEKAGQE